METQREEAQEKKDQSPQNDQPVKTEPNLETARHNQSQVLKTSKPKKIQYLNQKVYFPSNLQFIL